jgi:hypothetical protein
MTWDGGRISLSNPNFLLCSDSDALSNPNFLLCSDALSPTFSSVQMVVLFLNFRLPLFHLDSFDEIRRWSPSPLNSMESSYMTIHGTVTVVSVNSKYGSRPGRFHIRFLPLVTPLQDLQVNSPWVFPQEFFLFNLRRLQGMNSGVVPSKLGKAERPWLLWVMRKWWHIEYNQIQIIRWGPLNSALDFSHPKLLSARELKRETHQRKAGECEMPSLTPFWLVDILGILQTLQRPMEILQEKKWFPVNPNS